MGRPRPPTCAGGMAGADNPPARKTHIHLLQARDHHVATTSRNARYRATGQRNEQRHPMATGAIALEKWPQSRVAYTPSGQNRSVSRSAAAQPGHPGSAAAGRVDTTRLNRMARCWATFNFASIFGRLQYNYLGLLRAAIGGIYDASPSGKRPLILIHVAMSSAATFTDYYNHVVRAHIPFDAIGVSVYPFWGGTLAKAKTTLQALAFRFNKPIFIAETAYPHLEQPGEHKLRGLRYPMSPAGQAEYVSREIGILHSLRHGLGCGIIYWGGELLPPPAGPGLGPWPGRSLFGAGGEALRSLDVLGRAAFPKVPVHMKSIVR